MTDDEYTKYRQQFEYIIKRTLFSYPFYDKSDEELISDAINRDNKNLEFRLFKLGEREVKTVLARGKLVDTRYLPLISLRDDNKIQPIEIKITSFKYPSLFMSSVLDKEEKIRSTFNYETFDEYSDLYKAIEQYYGERILITTCWDTVTDFISITRSVNLVPIPRNDSEAAEIIRRSFIRERKRFIEDIYKKPKKYINFCPVDENLLAAAFKEFEPIFIEEVNRLNNYFLPGDYNNGDYETSPYDLARDNFYALTDGQEGDYPPDRNRYDENDDSEIARMMGY